MRSPLALVLMSLMPAVCAAAGQNFLKNGDFEEGFSDRGVPAEWQAYGGGAPQTSLVVSDVAASGRHSLLISDYNPAQEVGVSQTVEVPAEARFLVASVMVRAAEGGKGAGGFLQLRFLPSQKYLQTRLSASADEWRECRIAGERPEGTTSITVYLYTHRETICDTLVDKAQVIAMESQDELLLASDQLDLSAFPPPPVEKLKDLHLTTVLVEEGKAVACVVVPGDGRYEALGKQIVDAVAAMTGVRLPVKSDEDAPKVLTENTIILGNRSTNRLLSHLYDLYYTYLDLKYPGEGGYDVRSLHNPFGNGYNAILVGSSDDRGMAEATRQFIDVARAAVKGRNLVLDWTMRVKLGEGLTPPEKADEVKAWEESLMYPGASYFGWNSLSRRLALYYMTGDTKYLDAFLELAFPDEEAKQFLWKVDGERIEDKDHPLSGPYHYNAHHMMLLWDLVEESPYFSEEQRLRVTRAFAEQLRHWQAEWAYVGRYYGNPDIRIGSRHDQWAAVSLYVLSRYFQTYYPHAVWQKNLEAARHYFSPIAHSFQVAGELDHLWWYTTSYEPLVTYMILSGDRRGVESGNLQVLLRGFDLLVDGKRDGTYLRQLSLTFAHKCAYLTGDGRFLYYRDLTSLDTNVFRIGQSFWPTIAARAPEELAFKALARPLAPEEARASVPKIPYEQAFQFASYRTGITDHDDYLLVDGFYGGSRNPYHCLAVLHLRQGDKPLLDGYLNQVVVRQGGLVEPQVPLGAALTRCRALGKVGYLEAEVPDMAFGHWRRSIVHLADRWTLIVDRFQAREDARNLELAVQWELPVTPSLTEDGCLAYKVGDREARLVPWVRAPMETNGRVAICALQADLRKGEGVDMATALGLTPAKEDLMCARAGNGAAIVSDGSPVLAVWGREDVASEGETTAHLALIGQEALYGAEVRRLWVGALLLEADRPLDVYWDLASGRAEVEANQTALVGLRVADAAALKLDEKPCKPAREGEGLVWIEVEKGRHSLTGVVLPAAAAQALGEKLQQIATEASRPEMSAAQAAEAEVSTVEPDWAVTVEDEVRGILPGPAQSGQGEDGPVLYAIAGGKRVVPVGANGGTGRPIEVGAELMSYCYWPEARLLLLGTKDDKVHAIDTIGTVKWTFQSVMHPDLYATGKTYWFKQDLPGISGLLTGNLTGEGTQAFVGSACTIEVIDAQGQLIKRVPQYWGSVWRMAVLVMPDGKRRLLAAKMPNGVNDIGIVDGTTWSVSYGFTGLPSGHTPIAGWSSMNCQDLIVADLEGDGNQEVVMDVNGSWNRVCVYAADGTPRWAQSFGPSLKYPYRHMRGVVVADLEGDGKCGVVAATRDRIVTAFNAAGGQQWVLRLGSAPWCMTTAAVAGGARVIVGCEDGTVVIIDSTGKPVGRCKLESRVTALLAGQEDGKTYVWAGTAKGMLVRLPL